MLLSHGFSIQYTWKMRRKKQNWIPQIESNDFVLLERNDEQNFSIRLANKQSNWTFLRAHTQYTLYICYVQKGKYDNFCHEQLFEHISIYDHIKAITILLVGSKKIIFMFCTVYHCYVSAECGYIAIWWKTNFYFKISFNRTHDICLNRTWKEQEGTKKHL